MFCAFSDADSGQDMSEFNWDDYLEETGALSVPHHAFKHVSKQLGVVTPLLLLFHFLLMPHTHIFDTFDLL